VFLAVQALLWKALFVALSAQIRQLSLQEAYLQLQLSRWLPLAASTDSSADVLDSSPDHRSDHHADDLHDDGLYKDDDTQGEEDTPSPSKALAVEELPSVSAAEEAAEEQREREAAVVQSQAVTAAMAPVSHKLGMLKGVQAGLIVYVFIEAIVRSLLSSSSLLFMDPYLQRLVIAHFVLADLPWLASLLHQLFLFTFAVHLGCRLSPPSPLPILSSSLFSSSVMQMVSASTCRGGQSSRCRISSAHLASSRQQWRRLHRPCQLSFLRLLLLSIFPFLSRVVAFLSAFP